ncbi:hypothetical protein [Flavobacterium sp. FlaQc-50]|uniref:hypothetical protein n=1 Tax=unclassified Flavobacterium TaxID=196869 RepID=UPI003757CF60
MSNQKTVIFRLTEGRTPASWSISGGFSVKPGKGRKLINYFPGSDSYFVEDQTSDIKAEEVIFMYNDILTDPATEIEVSVDNTALIGYLKAHPFFNLHYKIHNEDMLSEEKLQALDKVERAFELIKETDDLKIKAMALVVFKIDAHGWSAVKAKAELKEKATKDPEVIIKALEADNYQTKYLAALAFYSGIVTDNATRTAVVWNDDNQFEILKLAVGENGIQKLTEKLCVSDDESNLILQQIGTKLDALNTPKAEATNITPVTTSNAAPTKSEAEIAEEAIERYKASLTPVKSEAEIRAEIEKEYGAKNLGSGTSDAELEGNDLSRAQAQYKELFGKDVANLKKNDLKWINEQIALKNK